MEEKTTGEGGSPVEGEQRTAVLYVGDLDPSVTEADLINAFDRFGPPSSARVFRDSNSGSSLRYAFLNFPSLDLAEKALREMNHSPLNGKPMRIMWCARDSVTRKSGIGNLFVKNLDVSVDGSALERMFSDYGTVVSCKVSVDEKGISKGFGFVQMESEEAALSAIKGLNGKDLKDGVKKLYVSKFLKKSEREASPMEFKCSNLYIKNLSSDITNELLQDKFSEFGKVHSAIVMKDSNGKSKGFGFVSFELPEHAKIAMEAMNGSKLGSGSKILYVGPAQKKEEREKILKSQFGKKLDQPLKKSQSETVYVKNLDISVDDRKLLEHFVGCGKIMSARVLRDPNGQSRGFGFVRFSSPDEANKAITTLNGSMLNNKALYIGTARRINTFRKFQSAKSFPYQDPLYTTNYYIPHAHAPCSGRPQCVAHGNQMYIYQHPKLGMDYSLKHSSYQFDSSPLKMTGYIDFPISSYWSGKGHSDAYSSQCEVPKSSKYQGQNNASTEMVTKLITQRYSAQRLRALAMGEKQQLVFPQIQKKLTTEDKMELEVLKHGKARAVKVVGPGNGTSITA
ncbi:polyadenylate-binding protein 8-like isoform X3 [Dioscorea cayenensis subsp. rotundata]|uniref:Polyadenylate-binding protein 8-like isoform X3 n=1 Tax=Dioscorea cayennensis subsp. rotundata TaxID=55577 RepID=A0AB40B3H8_DIOCR|nr:polyadenylate-binding protein 8-like isoform X3 [Dioscorea cayenensis subsp. rotundata]